MVQDIQPASSFSFALPVLPTASSLQPASSFLLLRPRFLSNSIIYLSPSFFLPFPTVSSLSLLRPPFFSTSIIYLPPSFSLPFHQHHLSFPFLLPFFSTSVISLSLLRPPFLSPSIIPSLSLPTFGSQEDRPKFRVSWLIKVPAELLAAVHRNEGPRRGIVYSILFSHICIFFAMSECCVVPLTSVCVFWVLWYVGKGVLKDCLIFCCFFYVLWGLDSSGEFLFWLFFFLSFRKH